MEEYHFGFEADEKIDVVLLPSVSMSRDVMLGCIYGVKTEQKTHSTMFFNLVLGQKSACKVFSPLRLTIGVFSSNHPRTLA